MSDDGSEKSSQHSFEETRKKIKKTDEDDERSSIEGDDKDPEVYTSHLKPRIHLMRIKEPMDMCCGSRRRRRSRSRSCRSRKRRSRSCRSRSRRRR